MAKRERNTDKRTDDARRFAVAAARVTCDANCEEILVLDLRGVSPVTDYFVIATSTSSRQARSVAEDLRDLGGESDMRVWQVAGQESAEWIVLDFVDVVVHLFDADHRHYYDLELIWGDAPRVPWEEAEASAERSS